MVRVYRAWDSDKQRFNEYTKTGRSRRFTIEPILLPDLKRAAEGHTRELVFETLDRPYDWLRADRRAFSADQPGRGRGAHESSPLRYGPD